MPLARKPEQLNEVELADREFNWRATSFAAKLTKWTMAIMTITSAFNVAEDLGARTETPAIHHEERDTAINGLIEIAGIASLKFLETQSRAQADFYKNLRE